MRLTFRCTKGQLSSAVRSVAGVRNAGLATDEDVKEAVRMLMDGLDICHTVPEGRVYELYGTKADGDGVIVSLSPGLFLKVFGDGSGIRDADKKHMRKEFLMLQEAVIGNASE